MFPYGPFNYNKSEVVPYKETLPATNCLTVVLRSCFLSPLVLPTVFTAPLLDIVKKWLIVYVCVYWGWQDIFIAQNSFIPISLGIIEINQYNKKMHGAYTGGLFLIETSTKWHTSNCHLQHFHQFYRYLGLFSPPSLVSIRTDWDRRWTFLILHGHNSKW